MTSIAQIKLAHGAGEPDSVPARHLDVIRAAEALYDAQCAGDYEAADKAEMRLYTAIERLRKARKANARQRGIA